MLKKIIFTSDDLPSGLADKPRFDMWREIHNERIAVFDYGISENVPFHARLEIVGIGPLAVGEMSGSVNQADRTAQNISADAATGYSFFINTGLHAMGGVQSGREFVINPGDAVLYSGSEPLKSWGRGATNSWQCIILPTGTLDLAFSDADDKTAMVIGAESEPLALLRSFGEYVKGGALSSAAMLTHAAHTITDLAGSAAGLRARGEELGPARGIRAARLAAVLEIVSLSFCDPGFSAESAAKKLNVSTRYVYDLLQDSGTGFSERVMEMRLERACLMLANPLNSHMRVSDIALACGFNDISYFNRSFRRRFGCTPTAAR